jgi:hypothetical protein
MGRFADNPAGASAMQSEIFEIGPWKVACDIVESELALDRSGKSRITMLAFVFGGLPGDMLAKAGIRLWFEVARRYAAFKRDRTRDPASEVIGRISFTCGETRVEYEFSRLTKSAVSHLDRLAAFVKQYPQSEEIRILRDGPTLIRFRAMAPEPAPENRPPDPLARVAATLDRFRTKAGRIWPGRK